MNAVARAQLTSQMLTLLKKIPLYTTEWSQHRTRPIICNICSRVLLINLLFACHTFISCRPGDNASSAKYCRIMLRKSVHIAMEFSANTIESQSGQNLAECNICAIFKPYITW